MKLLEIVSMMDYQRALASMAYKLFERKTG